jgi:hypothetical protein
MAKKDTNVVRLKPRAKPRAGRKQTKPLEIEIVRAFCASIKNGELDDLKPLIGKIPAKAVRERIWRQVYARVPCTEAEFSTAMDEFLVVLEKHRRI